MERTEHDKQAKHNKMNGSAHGQVTKQIFPKYTKGKEEMEETIYWHKI
jgi:hypothetical protein